MLLQCKQFDAVVARVANFSVAEGDVGFLEGLAVRRDSGRAGFSLRGIKILFVR